MSRASLLVLLLLLTAPAGHADTLKLANGDVIHGEILNWAIDHVVIEHPQLGVIRLSLEQLDIDTGAPPNPGLFGTTFLRGWSRSFGLGVNGKQGTTDSTNVAVTLDLDYEDEFKRWVADGRYFYNTSDDDDGDNNGRFDLRRDWLFPGDRYFVRSFARYQYDQFEAWKHRLIVGAGPGYRVFDFETQTLDLSFGPAFTREFGDRKDNKGDFVASLDYAWQPLERLEFSLSNQFFKQFAPSSSEYRNFTIAQWRLLLTEKPRFNLSLRLENEYDSEVDEGDENNTLNYFLTMGIDF